MVVQVLSVYLNQWWITSALEWECYGNITDIPDPTVKDKIEKVVTNNSAIYSVK